MPTRRLLVVWLLAVVLAAPLAAQAPPNLALARVRYNTLKTNLKPTGDLKAQIDAVEEEIAAALRFGQSAQVRRLIAKGTALLNGRSWTDQDDFDQSLALKSDRLFADSSIPYVARLEQVFSPTLQLATPPSAKVSLRPLLAQPAGAPEKKTVAEFDSISRDLRDDPLMMRIDLSGVADGTYSFDVEVLHEGSPIGTASMRLTLIKGLDARLAELERAASAAPERLRADIRYPGDYVRRVNQGVLEAGTFVLARELESAETIAAAARSGKDPFSDRKGHFERHYLLDAAGEIMPYRLFIPSSYNSAKPTPLVVALHGLGGSEDGWMDAYQQQLPALAEQHGFIAVSPLGYRADGFYGYSYGSDPASRRKQELSEQDVMNVLARVRTDYKVDPARIYLMGHSMGAIGTWFLAAKYPDIWAALGPIAGTGNPKSMDRMRHIPQFVVHGDADPTVPVSGSRNMVASMKTLGVDHVYVEVPGGDHSNIVVPNLPAMFAFFRTKQRAGNDSPSDTAQPGGAGDQFGGRR
jgi:poly(3-hydroxybutyrate) depolymerase